MTVTLTSHRRSNGRAPEPNPVRTPTPELTIALAERFNRTLKEQAMYGRVFRNIEEIRAAVTAFKERYNRHWRLEKLGFLSPLEARQPDALREAA